MRFSSANLPNTVRIRFVLYLAHRIVRRVALSRLPKSVVVGEAFTFLSKSLVLGEAFNFIKVDCFG